MSSPYVGWIAVDLNYASLIGIELGPGEIRSKLEQDFAVENGVITCWPADDTRHADIVRIVVLDEVLAARGVGHRRLQPCRRGNDLVMCIGTAGARIDRNRAAPVQDGCDLVEIRIARADEGTSHMDGIGQFVMRCRIGDIHRYDEYGYAAFR